MKHITVKLKKEVDVDKEIAPLIQLLWDNEIETRFSCQGDSKMKAQISFNSERDFLRFMNNLLEFDPDLRLLIMPRPEDKYGWRLSLGIFNEKRSLKNSKLVYYLFFPKKDIIWLTNVWEQIKKGRKSSFDKISFPKEIQFNVDKKLELIRRTIQERYS